MYKKWLANLIGQRGFTLPEIMIGGAILAGVGLAGATLFRNQGKAQSRLEQTKILIQYHSKTSKLIAMNQNCNVTLKNLLLQPSLGPTPITQLKLCDEVTYPIKCASKDADPSEYNASTTPYIAVGGYIDPAQIWFLESITFPENRSTTGPFKIRMNYAKNPRLGDEKVAKDITVNVRFSLSPVQFQECFNDQESSVNNLQNDMCSTLMVVGSSGGLSTWDELTQKCVMRENKTVNGLKNCPAGSQMIAWTDGSGNLRCRDLEEGPKDTAVNPAAATCVAPTKPHLRVVAGVLRVVCL